MTAIKLKDFLKQVNQGSLIAAIVVAGCLFMSYFSESAIIENKCIFIISFLGELPLDDCIYGLLLYLVVVSILLCYKKENYDIKSSVVVLLFLNLSIFPISYTTHQWQLIALINILIGCYISYFAIKVLSSKKLIFSTILGIVLLLVSPVFLIPRGMVSCFNLNITSENIRLSKPPFFYNWTYANLANINFNYPTMQNVDFSNATIRRCTINSNIIDTCIFGNTTFINTQIASNTNITRTNFIGTIFQASEEGRNQMSTVWFRNNCLIDGVNFTSIILDSTEFRQCTIQNITIRNTASLIKTDFCNSTLDSVSINTLNELREFNPEIMQRCLYGELCLKVQK